MPSPVLLINLGAIGKFESMCDVSIDIKLNCEQMAGDDTVRAGQELTGTVFIKPSNAINRGALDLFILGKEASLVQTNSQQRTVVTGSQLLRRMIVEELQPGVHEVTFNVKLPASLPTSTAVEVRQAVVNTSYEIRATFTELVTDHADGVRATGWNESTLPRHERPPPKQKEKQVSTKNKMAGERQIPMVVAESCPIDSLATVPTVIVVPSCKNASDKSLRSQESGLDHMARPFRKARGKEYRKQQSTHGQDCTDNRKGFEVTDGRGTTCTASRNDEQRSIAEPASLKILLDEMMIMDDAFEIISRKLKEDRWREMLSSLNANEFGCVLAHVKDESDRPRLAALLAPQMKNGFSCEYAAAAVRKTRFRMSMAHRLLPFCMDVKTNAKLIKDELDEWDLRLLRNSTSAF